MYTRTVAVIMFIMRVLPHESEKLIHLIIVSNMTPTPYAKAPPHPAITRFSNAAIKHFPLVAHVFNAPTANKAVVVEIPAAINPCFGSFEKKMG